MHLLPFCCNPPQFLKNISKLILMIIEIPGDFMSPMILTYFCCSFFYSSYITNILKIYNHSPVNIEMYRIIDIDTMNILAVNQIKVL